jgi:hypothetical protein
MTAENFVNWLKGYFDLVQFAESEELPILHRKNYQFFIGRLKINYIPKLRQLSFVIGCRDFMN